MANRTVKDAKSIHGTNPQYLVEKIVRSRVYDSKYWKEECFALSAELVVDKAMELNYIGGIYGGYIKPTPFLCLTLKMLQIQPEKDIVVEFIKNEEFKYVRALGAFYMRLVGSSLDCYKYLEPLYNDNRKLRRRNRQGQFECIHMDELIDELLREERVCDIILPRIQKRYILEENNEIESKVSALDDDFDEGIDSSGDDDELQSAFEKRYSLDEYWNKDQGKMRSVNKNRTSERTREREKHYRNRYRERSHSRDRKPIKKSPVRYRDENQKKDDRKRSPNNKIVPDKDRDRKQKDRNKDRSHDRDKYRDVDRSKERRHRSKSPRRRKGK